MITDEHLNKIVAWCERTLAAAETRTPGKWAKVRMAWPGQPDRFAVFGDHGPGYSSNANDHLIATMCGKHSKHEADADFTAAAAGAFEVTLKTTIMTIRALLRIRDGGIGYRSPDAQHAAMDLQELGQLWPEDMLV